MNWLWAQVGADLLPLLTDLERQAKAEGLRADGFTDDVDKIMAKLRRKWADRAEFLTTTVNDTAKRISSFNATQIRHQMRTVLGLDVLAAEPWHKAELGVYTRANLHLIRDIGEKAIGNLDRIVTDGVRSGALTRDIRRQIQDELQTTRKRATLIARDQVGKFNGRLTELRHRGVGVGEYTWRTMGDGRVRPAHVARDGKRFKWSNPPGDGHPGQPIQCRCYAEPVLDEFADLMVPADGTPGATPPQPAVVRKPPQAKPKADPKRKTVASGVPVSQAINMAGVMYNRTAPAIDYALKAIDSVHGDGKLPRIPVRPMRSTGGVQGTYASYGPASLYIEVNELGTHKELTAIHELGHFIDHQGITPGTFTSLKGREMADVLKAIDGSRAVAELRIVERTGITKVQEADGTEVEHLVPQKHFRYLLKREELWARAYAQYIATKTGDRVLLNQLDLLRAKDSLDRARQWDEDDFRPIMGAIDAMMEALGWRQPKRPRP